MAAYEILMGRKPNLKYFHIFGCVGYVLNDRDHLAKLDSKSDKCLFLGYSMNSKAYRVYNLRTRTTMESINVVFDNCADLTGKSKDDDTEGLRETNTGVETGVKSSTATPSTTPSQDPTESVENEEVEDAVILNDGKDIPSKIQKNHPSSQIIGEVHEDVQTRKKDKVDYRKMIGLVCISSTYSQVSHSCFVSLIEPKNITEALKDEFWVNAMHEELEQFVRNDVWDLVPSLPNTNVIGTKWIFKNKTDESGNIC
ncbi:uncharacterized protein LOC142528479 [Primulina tabacum]|uniref:uncharacterized protein LOC142528479 n=1 Tax=Primulina tabacum TaxID=48773 RepID=UPI003F5A0E17